MKKLILLALWLVPLSSALDLPGTSKWYRGNLHTHTFWSDGNDFPEMVAEWYKTNGYHFLALSDHNIVLQGEKWILTRTNATFKKAVEEYSQRFPQKVKYRDEQKGRAIRLSPLDEIKELLEEPGRFIMIPSEEISASFEKLPIHINVSNIRELIKPLGGSSVLDVMQKNIDAVLEQRRRTGQPMFPHLNHPNFHYAVKAEELMMVKGERFFEVYNGHPTVYNDGNKDHPSTEVIWDIVLAWRHGVLGMEPMYGIAVDDSHNYYEFGPKQSNSGRGWVMVRASRLTPASLIKAMEAGDFYASSGVTLKKVTRSGKKLSVEVAPESGVDYTIEFFGTRQDAFNRDTDGKVAADPAKIGVVFAKQEGTKGSYTLKPGELYVRAKITSSKAMANGVVAGEKERAWTQPLMGKAPRRK